MQLRFQRRGAVTVALLLSVIPLRADITLPTAATPPPQADAQALRIWRGDRATIPLRGHHGGSGSVTFWIVDRPEHGRLSELQLLGDNRATIVYQHDGTEPVSSDRFTYAVKTSGDQVSTPAEVRIIVEEPPPRLRVPGQIEFDEIVAGESQTRQLTITNEGGGVLEGRLTASAPWGLASADYRVPSGKIETIDVVFRPDEGREFIGQITLIGTDGAQSNVILEGSATSPVHLEPSQLRIALPKQATELRAASFSLTNRTDQLLKLKFSASRSIQPVADVALAPSEQKMISVVLTADRTISVHEAIVLRGDGFNARLPVEAEALPPEQKPPRPHPIAEAPAASLGPGATTILPAPAQPNVVRPEANALPDRTAPSHLLVPVRAQRLEGAHWELRWARPKEPVAHYRVEERFLAIDGAGELQAIWRAVASPTIALVGDSVTVQIRGLDSKQIHSLKVTALGPDGATLWNSPLLALSPLPEPSHRARNWALILGIALVGLIVLRWRVNQPGP